MTQYQVTCIKLGASDPNHEDEHQRITHIGGPPAWRPISVAEAVLMMSVGNEYFVKDQHGNVAWVRIIRPAAGKPYLRTVRDGVVTDNLRELPECH